MLKKTINRILLFYLRNSPIEIFKSALVNLVDLSLYNSPIIYTNRNGISTELDLFEHSHRNIFLYDFYERNTYLNLRKLIQPNFICFDIGANIGFYTLNIARQLHTGSVHCFEPNPIVFQKLRKNILSNNLTNVFSNNFGLSNKPGKATFFIPQSHHGAASLHKSTIKNAQAIEVELTTLDEYCKRKNINNVDLIKVDIEGHEKFFLEGAIKTIYKSKKLILVMEMSHENFKAAGYKSQELIDYLTQLDFTPYFPKSFPNRLRKVDRLPEDYGDNLIFLKGY